MITPKIARNQLIHLQLQAIMRENVIPDTEIKYLGLREGDHWYLIANEHEVPAQDIMDVTAVDD